MRIYDNKNVEHKKAILIHHVTMGGERERGTRMAHLFRVNVVSMQRLSGSLAKNDNDVPFHVNGTKLDHDRKKSLH